MFESLELLADTSRNIALGMCTCLIVAVAARFFR